MQKAKKHSLRVCWEALLLPIAVMSFSTMAQAADLETDPMVTAGEKVIEPFVVDKQENVSTIVHDDFAPGTLGSLAEKQKRLFELELDSKIKEAEEKLTDKGPAQTISMAPPVEMATLAPHKKTKLEDLPPDVRLLAIYGPQDQLSAELVFNGLSYNATRGNKLAEGWTVKQIQNDEILLDNGKKVMTYKLNLRDKTDFYQGASAISLPPLPNAAVPDSTSFSAPNVKPAKTGAVTPMPAAGAQAYAPPPGNR